MAVWTFAISAAFILYVLFGYPAWLALRARSSKKAVRKAPFFPAVSLLLPVRNGERWLRAKLESILQLNYPRQLLQILVISDGSTDRTDEIAREYASAGVNLIRIPAGGKAAALNAGMREARGEILFFTDVRQELDPEALRSLAACFADPEVGVASGELMILAGETREQADTGLYWRYEKWIRVRQSRIDSVLGATGCIYAMRRNLAVSLPPDTLLDDVYLPLAAFFRGYRIVLDEGAKAFDSPASLDTEFGRKVRTLAGVYQVLRSTSVPRWHGHAQVAPASSRVRTWLGGIVSAWPALLGPGNRMWFHFVSHKLGRLLLPYALIAIAVSSFMLADPWRTAALAAQGVFYGLAAADLAVPENWRLKRLSSPVRTFTVLMAAAVLAVQGLFGRGKDLWRETRAG